MELPAARVTLRHAPVDDADHLLPGPAARCHEDLTARLAGRLVNDDFVTALGRDAGGFESGRTGADDHHLTLHFCGSDFVRHGELTTRGCIVNAVGRAALVDAV